MTEPNEMMEPLATHNFDLEDESLPIFQDPHIGPDGRTSLEHMVGSAPAPGINKQFAGKEEGLVVDPDSGEKIGRVAEVHSVYLPTGFRPGIHQLFGFGPQEPLTKSDTLRVKIAAFREPGPRRQKMAVVLIKMEEQL